MSALDGQDNAGDATPLAPLSFPLLLLLSTNAEEDVAGGVPLSAITDLDAIPANKEDIVNADDNGAMAAAAIVMPDTTGGNDAREVIILALLLLT